MSIWNRLFFTADDPSQGELDLGWLLLLIGFLNAVIIFDLAAFGVVTVTVAAWTFYGSVITMCFIAGTTISRARLIANSKALGEVTKGIASAVDPGISTDIRELSGYEENSDDIG